MNAKKVKSLRKAIRARGLHPRAVETVEPAPGRHIGGLANFIGKNAGFLGQRILTKDCGRAYYQAAKRAVKRGGQLHAV